MSTINETVEKAQASQKSRHDYPVTWVHPDGREITIYSDHKRRDGYPNSNARPNVHTINQHLVDEWPILRRETVGSLTDAEWYASPGEEWTKPLA